MHVPDSIIKCERKFNQKRKKILLILFNTYRAIGETLYSCLNIIIENKIKVYNYIYLNA